ncbi:MULTISPECIES: Hsp70 family protein [unclassified Rhodococcus (in: high G+C Gram-positive bacteria)]|uniref:Hsp70 family protein n=1 Tax=unclassified Rhodococcus (in: high G+C Gram-positive bacteria) TaxID=192944 RepID=UPI00163AAB57|nr:MULTISPECIES: Hsp70 family protein [unclassified Rhodococcus (in: high G+C Gram-positive bacteria)]MBC2641133.1 Hsp70 family protein [Rhodococcus sp. 3A]MBC2894122.1 Hsp70 family protein [Rhodococcus sp. 4CII]
MTSVLGVSVGASAVRFARHDAVSLDTPIFESRSVTATLERPEELAAESIGTVLAERDEVDEVQAIGVAYQDEAQAGAVQAAMARLQIGNFQLVPEVTAALQMLEMSGELGDHATLVFYDLGSSGLTVTVVDRDTGMVLSSARSDQISGDLVDRLICDNQLELQRFAHPADAAAALALAARCRDAKEQLSTHGAVCMPGEGGLLLLSQDGFDSLIASPVETSARLTREVIRRSGRVPDAAVLIGGGAHIPLVTSVMESWLDLPVIVPAQPELVAAEGAALLARPMAGEFVGAAPLLPDEEFDAEPLPQPDVESWADSPSDAAPPARRRRGFVLAGGAVAVVAAIGLGIGVGTDLLQGSDEEAQPAATQQATQAPSVQRAAPAKPTTAADVPPAADLVPSAVEEQPVIPPQTEVRGTYQSQMQAQTQSPARAPVVPGTQDAVPSDTSAPTTTPEPAPLIPGLPQIQLPTIPPPAPLPMPELPRIPGL